MPTNTRESGLETLIIDWLTDKNGYEQGASADYNRDYAVDEPRLFRFLETTQPEQMAKLGIAGSDLKRIQFLDRSRRRIWQTSQIVYIQPEVFLVDLQYWIGVFI